MDKKIYVFEEDRKVFGETEDVLVLNLDLQTQKRVRSFQMSHETSVCRFGDERD